jgi:hypothetical protein
MTEGQSRPRRIAGYLIGALVCAGLIGALSILSYAMKHRGTPSRPQVKPVAQATTTAQSEMPQKKPTDEVWNESTPVTRRSILTNHIRRTWKNVSVQNSDTVMTVTHPGMDEQGAQKIILDMGELAIGAGLRRVNFVRAGGVCQVTYTRPYCEVSCQEAAGCYPAGECNMICCSIYGSRPSQIPEVRQEACPTHTWVYDVPSSSGSTKPK